MSPSPGVSTTVRETSCGLPFLDFLDFTLSTYSTVSLREMDRFLQLYELFACRFQLFLKYLKNKQEYFFPGQQTECQYLRFVSILQVCTLTSNRSNHLQYNQNNYFLASCAKPGLRSPVRRLRPQSLQVVVVPEQLQHGGGLPRARRARQHEADAYRGTVTLVLAAAYSRAVK